ncbi:hypothetical protein SETIT_8G075400v2 [Setaria italica]|uniref:Bifunctional inhibitor/plant lipid transfer protein/seed storage helical domain-containing protein n=1 Tax=Setaria italica TaxID=4555 RepID=A0A368S5G7_SETIT|nr:hypothetical protein SETIT_8G075400v2 [Setaria italica]
MLPVKVAALLLVCLTMYPHIVVGTCTKEQKNRIIVDCKKFIGHGPPHPFPRDPHAACCIAAREVPMMDMECIVDLLTAGEKKNYDENKIKGLRDFCMPRRRRQAVA